MIHKDIVQDLNKRINDTISYTVYKHEEWDSIDVLRCIQDRLIWLIDFTKYLQSEFPESFNNKD